MNPNLHNLLQKLWEDYARINPQAQKIHDLLTRHGEKVINDHIAFRTFNLPRVGIDVLAEHFLDFGYSAKAEYEFPVKKLKARHFEHPNPENPKIFISELKLEECSQNLQKIVSGLVEPISPEVTVLEDFPVAGTLWPKVAWDIYQELKQESEYAAWLAVFGFRANHFTVLVNALKNFQSLQELNNFLKQNGFPLNTSGGEIKGTARDYLEQSSTLAAPVEMEFPGGKRNIPGCYYEFARRYPLPEGTLYQGFVEKSADKIFESTDNK